MNPTLNGRSLTVHCAGPLPDPTDRGRAWAQDGVHLRFALLSDLRERLDDFIRWLDAEEKARMDRFRFDLDRERFISAHGWMRELLGQRLGVPPEALRFRRGPHGKPVVEGHDLPFNLSDTKDAVVMAVSDAGEIGVDVETMARRVDHEAVSAHYFTPEETAHIAAGEDPKQRFLELWTRKEAVLKASGVGIMDDLHVLRVDQAENTCTIIHPAFIALAAPAYRVRTWHVDPHHIVSLATAF